MAVDADARGEPKETLETMEVHSSWARHFRTTENDPFYNAAFDYIDEVFGRARGATVVDAGCGSATKTLQLVKRGYRVRGLDFSEAVLAQARAAVAAAGVSDQVTFETADLTALTLPDASVERMVCWGVMMHIPDVERVVVELSRVLAPGGVLVVSEGNLRSLQAVGLRALKGLMGKERAELVRRPPGLEFWEQTDSGRLMTRQADVPWLIRAFQAEGLRLEARRAGQFSELYTLLPWKPARQLVHAVNGVWFRAIRAGGPAFGNLLVLRKPASASR
jgi:SAM-dependent methyltransferase